jgi:alanine-synthesizing transaminase
MEILSKFSKYAENAIEEENPTVESLVKAGKEITRLNIGDPARFFPTPEYMINAYIKALKEGKTGYVEPEGIPELREAVSNRYKRLYNVNADDHDSIFITHGVSEALIFLNSMLVNAGDMAVIFKPYYSVSYSGFRLFGGEPIFQHYQEEKNWDVDTDELDRKIKEAKKEGKTVKYISITNPSNPTGMVLDRKELQRIVEIAKNNDLVIISDEIYDEVIFNGAKFTSISQIADGVPHIIFNGASKDLDATGFRIGFVLVPGDDKASAQIKKSMSDYCAVRLCVNTPAQYAVVEGVNNIKEHEKEVGMFVKAIEERADFASKLINESEYMHVVPPRGAYYLLPKLNMEKLKIKNDREFVHQLLIEENVLLTRGSGFGGENHIRLVALPSKEILEFAIDKIDKFCRRHSK